MAKVSVLGLGGMGSRMAANLIKAGYLVTVWNRTSAATADLVAAGARAAETPRQAAAEADFVLSMVRDNEASRFVWLDPEIGALPAMDKDATAIESSTLTPNWIRELGAAFTARGVSFLEAPVSGSRPQAESGQLLFFAGGAEATLARTTPLLRTMGSDIRHTGELGTAALAKLTTNALLGIQVTALAELIGMLQRSGADPGRVLQAVSAASAWSPAASYLAGSMLSGSFAPQFPIELIEKDFRYIVGAAGTEANVPTVLAALQVFQSAISCGYGDENMTGVVRLFTE
ncbi:NAD(P)-dependent oxidoreductase [Ensifer sp. YR511]|uniref:NAD(P)-dependent oxidoreductase n=1 Tax=Ensifer sp. YR511 TaxID=1855294 RepID=UPI000886A59E|nr:NAD(P)-dependent oxidoreductase [Ensifer sp. YR511]SDN02924.1 3-hydroxyisobutyrate dehydrogenase [Ensifer sp. YR511]